MKLKGYRCGYYCTDFDELRRFGLASSKDVKRLKKWTSPSLLEGVDWRISFVKADNQLRHKRSKEAIIFAASQTQAQKAASLIFAAQYLPHGTNIFGGEPHLVVPYKKRKIIAFEVTDPVFPEETSDDIPRCCAIAAKASSNIQAENALSKYQLSCELFSSHYRDIETFCEDDAPRSPYAHDHVRLAYAIVIAYAVIEELGLEVRVKDIEKEVEKNGVKYIVKEKESSKLSNGEWNPSVKQDLERRLSAKGINLNEKFHWTGRGNPTPLETKRAPLIGKRWKSEVDYIRDGEIEVIDAISYISWLRSSISSHKLSDKAKNLTFLEVFNAQMLARRLLLEYLGFWRDW